MKRLIAAVLLLGVAALAVAAGGALADSTVTTPDGTWLAHPGQTTTFQTSVQQPINLDGSSRFPNNGKAVIPVKFSLSSGVGPFVFESLQSPFTYSFLDFSPNAVLTFGDITNLTANYTWTVGDCHGGALRWSVTVQTPSGDKTVHLYYGQYPQLGNGGVNGCGGNAIPTFNQSGLNMIALSQSETTPGTGRFDLNQDFGGPFYGLYSEALTALDAYPIVDITLALDAGWGGDQRVTLASATIGTTSFTQTFTPSPQTPLAKTCALPTPAEIKVTKLSGLPPTGQVNEPVSIQPKDTNGFFRVVDCKYMYNLATSSLSGSGKYKVEVVIGGNTAAGAAIFAIR